MSTQTMQPSLFELSRPGRRGTSLPNWMCPRPTCRPSMLRDDLPLPEVSEMDVVRHFVRLSQLNYAIDTGFYPLGSCTMKYNPKVNEAAARLPGFAHTHPYQPQETVQGNLCLAIRTPAGARRISGFDAVTLQPAAGAHGEFVGILVIRAYHQAHGDADRVHRPDPRLGARHQPRLDRHVRLPDRRDQIGRARQRRPGRPARPLRRTRGGHDAHQPQHAGPL